MLSKTKISTLIAIAGGGGMGVGIMALLLNKEKENYANQASFVQSAVSLMKSQSKIMELLGDDFQVGRASLQDGWGKVEKSNIRVMVPITGTNDRARLFVYARRTNPGEKFKLSKLEMTFDKVQGKKLVLMDIEKLLLDAEQKEKEMREKEEQEQKREERQRRLNSVLPPELQSDPNKKKTNHSYIK